jgi:hypothetical protein
LKNGTSMKIRILSIACVTAAVALLAACTAPFRNSDTCEQLMRSKLADTSSDTLRVTHRGAAIHGSRVVIEGTIEHVVVASEVAAAKAASSAPASGAIAASGVRKMPGAAGVKAASGVEVASGVQVGSGDEVASGLEVSSGLEAGSGVEAASGLDATSGVAVASGVDVASGVEVGSAASSAVGDTAASAAAASSAASVAKAAALKPSKPKTVVTPAAAECTFQGPDLNVFRWLAPAKLAAPPAQASGAAAG